MDPHKFRIGQTVHYYKRRTSVKSSAASVPSRANYRNEPVSLSTA